MIKVYKKDLGDSSSRKAIEWLEKYNLPYESLSRRDISEGDLLEILKLSNGIEQILCSPTKSQKVVKEIYEILDWQDTLLSDMLKIIKRCPSILRTPIMFDDKNLVVGYNEEEIRVFLPREIRETKRKVNQKE